jgi:glycosyltransferase involved in cell wall biosynthesis
LADPIRPRRSVVGVKVALDWGSLLDSPTGIGRYTRELARSLHARDVDVVRYAVALRGSSVDGLRRWRVPASAVQALWRTLGRPPIEALVGSVDLVHATNYVLPPLKKAAGVVTVHDLSFYRNESWAADARLRRLLPWALEQASMVVTPSRSIAAEVHERFALPADRLAVTHLGVSSHFFGALPLAETTLQAMGIRAPFALAVGKMQPRKNLHRLLRAWELAADALAGWTLVLAGPGGWGREPPPTQDVVMLGWVGDETLPGLLAAAEFFCYPSLYEGFGLPPLEAMAAGTPALVGAYPAAQELLGDAALLVDPEDVESIAHGLRQLSGDRPVTRRLQLAGKAKASTFTWERTADQTLEAYRKAME